MFTATGLDEAALAAAGRKVFRRDGKQVLLNRERRARLRHRQSLPA
ncbi:MAG: hypothetical protein WDM81_15900 [Rhizomicrobium sp.]